MNFKIKPLFTKADIEKDISKHMEVFHKLMFIELDKIGLEFVTDARNNANFDDQTGNLRSSIGYMIFYNGEFKSGNFELSKRGTERIPGRDAAIEFAQYQAALYPTGYVLITVAGMEYSSYVEAKDFDVITGSTNNASKKLKGAYESVKRALTK